MKTFGERFRTRREQLDLTQEEAAKAINRLLKGDRGTFTRVTISNIENGNQSSIKDKVLLAAVDVLKCSPRWLVYGEGPVEERNVNVAETSSHQRLIPLIDWVQAGAFTEVGSYPEDSYEYYPCPANLSDKAYALRVEGESMIPRFEPGDIIYIDPSQRQKINGKFVIARLVNENSTTFKQLQIIDGKIYLQALNPNYTPEMKFTHVNQDCEIIGTVVWHIKPV
ncbi:LexA family protein [Paramixta manurensis]